MYNCILKFHNIRNDRILEERSKYKGVNYSNRGVLVFHKKQSNHKTLYSDTSTLRKEVAPTVWIHEEKKIMLVLFGFLYEEDGTEHSND